MVAPTNDKNTIVGVGFQDDQLSLTSGSARRLGSRPLHRSCLQNKIQSIIIQSGRKASSKKNLSSRPKFSIFAFNFPLKNYIHIYPTGNKTPFPNKTDPSRPKLSIVNCQLSIKLKLVGHFGKIELNLGGGVYADFLIVDFRGFEP